MYARRRALQTAQALPLSAFSDEPHLKLSGIAIALAEVLESSNRPSEAYETYSAALAQLRASQATGKLSNKERMRAVALAHKLGEMAEVYQRGAEEAEEFLTFAVEEVLRVIKDGQAGIEVEGKGKERAEEGEVGTMLAELELPWWVSKVDVAAPLEALGRFYAQEGKSEYVRSHLLVFSGKSLTLLAQKLRDNAVPPGDRNAHEAGKREDGRVNICPKSLPCSPNHEQSLGPHVTREPKSCRIVGAPSTRRYRKDA